MRVDPDTCRDADLLAAEVRRLQAVIAACEPTLTDAERIAIEHGIAALESDDYVYGWLPTPHAENLRGLRQRLKRPFC